jgi:hypothetical protein
MNAILDTARAGHFTDDQCFRLLARLWTLKRMMYYIYGGSRSRPKIRNRSKMSSIFSSAPGHPNRAAP